MRKLDGLKGGIEMGLTQIERRIFKYFQKPKITILDVIKKERKHFETEEECEIFVMTAITKGHALEQLAKYREYRKQGIDVVLIWNSRNDYMEDYQNGEPGPGCAECHRRNQQPTTEDDIPPLHDGCRCWLTIGRR
jgi:hypothetical protein